MTTIFVCYSHLDRRWLDPKSPYPLIPWLENCLRRDGATLWYDRNGEAGLRPGAQFKREILSAIDHAQVALLLVSEAFFASDFIREVELPRILKRAENNGLVVIPVLLEPCDWRSFDFVASRQMLPDPPPLIDYTDSERRWVYARDQLLTGIRGRLRELPPPVPPAPPPRPASAEARSLLRELLIWRVPGKMGPPIWLWLMLAVCALVGLVLLVDGGFMQPPVIEKVWVSPAHPEVGQAVTVHWQVRNAQQTELAPLGYTFPSSTTSYTLREGVTKVRNLTLVATGRWGERSETISIVPNLAAPAAEGSPTPTPELASVTPTREPDAAPTTTPDLPVLESWTVSPSELVEGETVTMDWRVSNAESVTLTPWGAVETSGSRTHQPLTTSIYILTATRAGATQSWTRIVDVEPKPAPAPTIHSFEVSPDHVTAGHAPQVWLRWVTDGADTVTITPDIGEVEPIGSLPAPPPAGSTLYVLVASNAGGSTSAKKLLQVESPSCKTNDSVKSEVRSRHSL